MNFLKTFKASKIPKTVSILYFYQFNLSHLRRLRKSQVEVVAMPEHTQLAGRPNINHNTHSHVLCQPKSKLSTTKKHAYSVPSKKPVLKFASNSLVGKEKYMITRTQFVMQANNTTKPAKNTRNTRGNQNQAASLL